MTGPIKPHEAFAAKIESIPDAVFEAFNELIARELSENGRATVRQGDVVRLIEEKGITRRDLFDNNWLDVEPAYREAGWSVEYDKPGYNETYEAKFIFKKPSRGTSTICSRCRSGESDGGWCSDQDCPNNYQY